MIVLKTVRVQWGNQSAFILTTFPKPCLTPPRLFTSPDLASVGEFKPRFRLDDSPFLEALQSFFSFIERALVVTLYLPWLKTNAHLQFNYHSL